MLEVPTLGMTMNGPLFTFRRRVTPAPEKSTFICAAD